MDIFTGKLGPREIGLAAAFGVLLGLLPKDNLLFVACAVLFLFSHANLVLGLLVTAVVSFFAPWVHESAAHSLGYGVLISPAGQNLVAAVYRVPVLPWTNLDDTIVMGSFLLGLVLFFPIFFAAWIPLKIVWPKKEKPVEKDPTEMEPGGVSPR